MILSDKLQEIYAVESGTIFLVGTTFNSILSVHAARLVFRIIIYTLG